MNTPFKMKPGRGNMPKTGNGLPSPLRQESIELTKKYTTGRKKYEEQRNKGNVDSYLNVDATTGVAKAKPYEKKFVTNPTTKGASIIGGNNKTVATATSYGGGKEVKTLRAKFVKDSTNTMSDRNRKAEFYNANSGGTNPNNLNERQTRALVGIGKVKRTR